MSKLITDPNRASRLMGVLHNNVNFSEVPDSTVEWALQHPKEAGAQFTAFLKNGGRTIVWKLNIIQVDRTTPFDIKSFFGDSWTISEEDQRSLALTEVDLTAVQLETMLKKGENVINGEEKLKRLKSEKHIRLDAKFFQTFWKNKRLIPERWKEKTNGETTYISFDGTVLRSPNGGRFVLRLYWDKGVWYRSYDWLNGNWRVRSPSAVLAS